jgi:hypothetical protein
VADRDLAVDALRMRPIRTVVTGIEDDGAARQRTAAGRDGERKRDGKSPDATSLAGGQGDPVDSVKTTVLP